jgi:mono/diheme cytochrome c family protein
MLPGRGAGKTLGHLLVEAVRRIYAVGIIVLVVWLSFLALRYLVVTLMLPIAAPAQIIGIPTRLTEAVLETKRSQWPGVVDIENPRIPLAHYHRLDGWVQPDHFNTCTQSGCHAPLPHARRKEVRAFLNMHATSIHCGVCHLPSPDQPLATTWYGLASGTPRGAPAALVAYGWLVSAEGRQELAQPTPATQHRLVTLLRAAAEEADNVPALVQLATHVAAVRYDGAEFQQLVEAAHTILPRHFRGEYGSKLALRDRTSNRPLLGFPGAQQAIQTYLRQAPTADQARQEQLLAAVHPDLRVPSLHCTNCHTASGSLLDFAAAGYPPARIQMLSQPGIFTMIEHIASGQPFYLPSFMHPEAPAPSQPTSNP